MSRLSSVPTLAFLAVLALALMLIVGIVLRPWGFLDSLQVNASSGIHGGGQRSTPSYVGEERVVGWQYGSPPIAPGEEGRAYFITYGCASCHGLDGRGTRWAPMRVTRAEQVHAMVRVGPGGMPAYSKEYLPDEYVDAIARWLLSRTGGEGNTPAPTSTVEPSATSAATPTPLPGETPVQGDPDRGKEVYSQAGCAACHGNGGKGTSFAPELEADQLAQDYPGDDQLARLVRSGKGIMSGYDAGRLSDSQLADLIAYLRSLR